MAFIIDTHLLELGGTILFGQVLQLPTKEKNEIKSQIYFTFVVSDCCEFNLLIIHFNTYFIDIIFEIQKMKGTLL